MSRLTRTSNGASRTLLSLSGMRYNGEACADRRLFAQLAEEPFSQDRIDCDEVEEFVITLSDEKTKIVFKAKVTATKKVRFPINELVSRQFIVDRSDDVAIFELP